MLVKHAIIINMKKMAVFCLVLVLGFCLSSEVLAISTAQKTAISEKCDTLRDSLKNIQKMDARTRVFFGSHYETVLSKFITPLNLRLVENNISNINLIENQNNLASAKAKFSANYISYQQELEALIGIDCRTEPEKFYNKLVTVRKKRSGVASDIKKMKELVLSNIELTGALRGSL